MTQPRTVPVNSKLSILILLAIFSNSLLLNCGGQKRIPAETTRPTYIESSNHSDFFDDNEMRLVHSPRQSFWIDPYEQSELNAHEYFTAPHQMPRVSISVTEASKACQLQGKRLCTFNEWSNACLGTHRRRYAYASENNPQTCNTISREVAPTAAYKDCRTDTGLHDMIGNSMEWIADTRSGMAIAMGGSYHTGKRADCFTSFYFHPGIKSDQIGFRCCRDAQTDEHKTTETPETTEGSESLETPETTESEKEDGVINSESDKKPSEDSKSNKETETRDSTENEKQNN